MTLHHSLRVLAFLPGLSPGLAGMAAQPAGVEALPSWVPKIDRRPSPALWTRGYLTALPRFEHSVALADPWRLDLRHADLSGLALGERRRDLLFSSFDDGTKWPSASAMPEGFDTSRIMEFGKNPGLGVRGLHKLGVTGRGVGIAIIDQTLLVDHQDYSDRLRLYEESDDITGGWLRADMHGAAQASIAVGKTTGVAPGADLYYIATSRGGDGSDFSYLARCLRRVLAINTELPKHRKIRVVAMAIGWNAKSRGYAEITAATNEAKGSGLLVVCSSLMEVHGLRFHGLGRAPLADPELPTSYVPGLWWREQFDSGRWNRRALLVPMDSRATASPHDPGQFAFYRQGGWSWCIPYIAGLYALAAQVDSQITPERFWQTAMTTGATVRVKSGTRDVGFGPIVNPAALIELLRRGGR